jgi:hypothetical protein
MLHLFFFTRAILPHVFRVFACAALSRAPLFSPLLARARVLFQVRCSWAGRAHTGAGGEVPSQWPLAGGRRLTLTLVRPHALPYALPHALLREAEVTHQVFVTVCGASSPLGVFLLSGGRFRFETCLFMSHDVLLYFQAAAAAVPRSGRRRVTLCLKNGSRRAADADAQPLVCFAPLLDDRFGRVLGSDAHSLPFSLLSLSIFLSLSLSFSLSFSLSYICVLG